MVCPVASVTDSSSKKCMGAVPGRAACSIGMEKNQASADTFGKGSVSVRVWR